VAQRTGTEKCHIPLLVEPEDLHDLGLELNHANPTHVCQFPKYDKSLRTCALVMPPSSAKRALETVGMPRFSRSSKIR
jgi:hypothetical protein